MAIKIPATLYTRFTQSHWERTGRFIAMPLRISSSAIAPRHFTGGPPLHRGSKCEECKKPLTLLWNLDLQDRMIPEYVRDSFTPCTRLPFYVCLHCMAASYRLLSDKRMIALPFDHHSEFLLDFETPYVDAPFHLERRPVELSIVPSHIDAIQTLRRCLGRNETDTDTDSDELLRRYLRIKKVSRKPMAISQLGGGPLGVWRSGGILCPHPKCPASIERLDDNYEEWVNTYLMKELATIHWSDEPVLADHYFQLRYFVCSVCFSIRARYECS